MKTKILLLLVLSIYCFSNSSFAQYNRLDKEDQKEIKRRAKELEKDDWKPFPGSAGMKDMLAASYAMDSKKQIKNMSEYRYTCSSQYGKASVLDEAKKKAVENSLDEIATLLLSDISGEIVNTTAVTNEESQSDFKSIIKNRLGQELKDTRPVIEIYREKKGMVEVTVRICFDNTKKEAYVKYIQEAARKK